MRLSLLHENNLMQRWSFANFVIGPSEKVETMRLSDWGEFRRDPERDPSR